jgi:hypothetical protein
MAAKETAMHPHAMCPSLSQSVSLSVSKKISGVHFDSDTDCDCDFRLINIPQP